MQYFLPDLLFRDSATRRVQRPCHVGAMQIAAVARVAVKREERPDGSVGPSYVVEMIVIWRVLAVAGPRAAISSRNSGAAR